jgi:two-component system response regulator WspF
MRIAIVNDSLTAVEAMRRVVAGGGQHQIAWIAGDGSQAVEKAAADTPDLILMDLIMPVLDGIEATRRIMHSTPCAIVVVTADVDRNSPKVFEAMGAGALDAVNTPVLDNAAAGGGNALLGKIDTIRRLLGPDIPREGTKPGTRFFTHPQALAPGHLVAIGASAGGPLALAKILSRLDAAFPAPVIIVQHVDAQFAPGLATWLDAQTPLSVRLAREGDHPEVGTVLLAGEENHLVFTPATRLSYARDPMDCPYRPSIDVFLRSANRYWRGAITGVLLTGMGRDGAEGLKRLKDRGCRTIAQDRESSAVYGMPGAAADLGAATDILPLDKIAQRLTSIVGPSN